MHCVWHLGKGHKEGWMDRQKGLGVEWGWEGMEGREIRSH